MKNSKKLAAAALTGMLTVGLFAAQPAMAGEHEKAACKGKNGCKGEAAAEKTGCKGHSEKASCSGEAKGEKSSCKGSAGCNGKQ